MIYTTHHVRQHQMSSDVHHPEYILNMSKTVALPLIGIALQRLANFSKRARKNEKELVPAPILIDICDFYKMLFPYIINYSTQNQLIDRLFSVSITRMICSI